LESTGAEGNQGGKTALGESGGLDLGQRTIMREGTKKDVKGLH